MSDQVEGLIDVPKEFVKEGIQFMNKCQKRESPTVPERRGAVSTGEDELGGSVLQIGMTYSRRTSADHPLTTAGSLPTSNDATNANMIVSAADRKEFIKISQAIAMGFVAMGTVGYLVKLIHIPINNILVAGA
ncbi:hypothetical protein PWT90_04932 [Aphanocladium album]|nr:hypothetical protein PWT90_04932 [Aphanocladium album]